MVGEAVSTITRTTLTLGGAHGIFKTSMLEQLFRDGALGPLHPPPADFCLYNMGLYELGIAATAEAGLASHPQPRRIVTRHSAGIERR